MSDNGAITEQSGAELKPCPFCGGEAELRSSAGDTFGEDRVSWRVVCGNMMCQGGACNVWEATPEDAVGKWNTRAERTCRPTPMYDTIFECDVCGQVDTDGIPSYCPGCGAKVVE